MTDHAHCRELASARHDGELDAAWAEELDAHLRDCAECTAYAERLADLGGLARALPDEPMPVGLPDRIAAALPRARRRRAFTPTARWVWRLSVPALCAALATVLVVALGDVGRIGVFPLPAAAASEPLRALSTLYAERVVEERNGPVLNRRVVERIWYEAPDRLRVERDIEEIGLPPRTELVIRVPGAEYDSVTGATINRPPQIELPEPLSVTIPLLGTDAGPGPVIAGRATRTYELTFPGSGAVRRASVDVERPTALGVEQSIVLGKDGSGGFDLENITKRTRVIRYNEPIPDGRFALPGQLPPLDLGFHPAALSTLTVRPAAVPEGFRLVAAVRGRDSEAVEYAQGALLVVATISQTGEDATRNQDRLLGGDRFYDPFRQTVDLGDGRTGIVTLDLYAVPRLRLGYRGRTLTVAAPLPPAQLAQLVRQMYPE